MKEELMMMMIVYPPLVIIFGVPSLALVLVYQALILVGDVMAHRRHLNLISKVEITMRDKLRLLADLLTYLYSALHCYCCMRANRRVAIVRCAMTECAMMRYVRQAERFCTK